MKERKRISSSRRFLETDGLSAQLIQHRVTEEKVLGVKFGLGDSTFIY